MSESYSKRSEGEESQERYKRDEIDEYLDELERERQLDEICDEFLKELEKEREKSEDGEQDPGEDVGREERAEQYAETEERRQETSDDDEEKEHAERELDDIVDEIEREVRDTEKHREIDDVIDEIERELEQDQEIDRLLDDVEREMREEAEKQEPSEAGEREEHEYRAANGDAEERDEGAEDGSESSGEREETSEDTEADEVDRSIDECVKDAIREWEEEEAALAAEEAREMEAAEASSRELDAYEDPDELQKDVYEDFGIDREAVEERWEERVKEEIEEFLEEGAASESESTEKDTSDSTEHPEGGTAEGETYHDAGEGMVYATKQGEASEEAPSTDSEAHMETEDPEVEQADSAERGQEMEESESKREEPAESGRRSTARAKRAEPSTDSSKESGEYQSQEAPARQRERSTSEQQEMIDAHEEQESFSETNPEQSASDLRTEGPEGEEDLESKEVAVEDEESSEREHQLDDSEPSPCFPNGFHGIPGMFPEMEEDSEEQGAQEDLEELIRAIEEMSDTAIETVEDLDRLIEEHPEVREDEYFEEAYERAKRFLEFQQRLREEYTEEELAEKNYYDLAQEMGYKPWEIASWFLRNETPNLIRELKAKARRASLDGIFGDSETSQSETEESPAESAGSKQSLRQFLRTPESMDAVDRLLARHPYIRERKGFAKMYADAEAYFRMKSILQKEPVISDSKLARNVGKARSTVRKWRIGETQPDLFTRLAKNEKMRQKVENLIRDEALRNYIDPSIIYNAFSSQRLKKKLQLDTIVDALWNLARQVKSHTISFGLIRPYNSIHGPSWLSAVAEYIERNREEIQKNLNAEYGKKINTEYRISIVDNFLYIWNKKKEIFDYLDLMEKELFFFSLNYRKQITKDAMSSLGLKGYYNLSKLILDMTEYPQVNRSNQTRIISDFRPNSKHIMGMALRLILDSSHRTLKMIEPQITKIGGGRQVVDPNISVDKKPNHVHSSLKRSIEKETLSVAFIIEAILDTIHNQTSPVSSVKLSEFANQYNISWRPSFVKMMQSRRSEIQDKLNQLSKDSVNIAIVKRTLFIWKRNERISDFSDVFQNELFYFSTKYHKQLIKMARKDLNNMDDNHLSELIRQITGYSQKSKSGKPRIISAFQHSSRYLPGTILRFFLDVLQKPYSQIQHEVKKIGRGKQIVNPQVLDTEEFYVLMARLFAIINSDGTLDEDYRVHYYEQSSTRRKRVKDLLRILGNVETHDKKERDGSICGFRMPNVIGRVLAKLGMTVGDKITQGTRLPNFIKYGSPKIQRAYLEELIPEDGWVAIDKGGHARIGWSRTIALSDPEKESKYGALNLLAEKHIKLIIEYGDEKIRTYGGKSSDAFRILSISKLDELMNSNDPNIARIAHELDWIVRTNGPQLIFDEQELCEGNGIQTKTAIPSNISYSYQTQRVSVKWQTATSAQEDVALWGLLAPPNDVTKKRKLMKWMKQHSDLVSNAKTILRSMRDEIERITSELIREKKREEEGASSSS